MNHQKNLGYDTIQQRWSVLQQELNVLQYIGQREIEACRLIKPTGCCHHIRWNCSCISGKDVIWYSPCRLMVAEGILATTMLAAHVMGMFWAWCNPQDRNHTNSVKYRWMSKKISSAFWSLAQVPLPLSLHKFLQHRRVLIVLHVNDVPPWLIVQWDLRAMGMAVQFTLNSIAKVAYLLSPNKNRRVSICSWAKKSDLVSLLSDSISGPQNRSMWCSVTYSYITHLEYHPQHAYPYNATKMVFPQVYRYSYKSVIGWVHNPYAIVGSRLLPENNDLS